MSEVSTRYQGDKGREYFEAAGRFAGDQDLGRTWQSRYFAPFCDSGCTVLDFGCGDGTILRSLVAAKKLAVEVNPYCLERIQNFQSQADVPLEVRGGIEEWHDESADVVISNHALEHVLEPYHVLKGMYRVLRPGGRCVLVTPYDDWRASGQSAWKAADGQNHLYTWNPMNIGNLLTEVGFAVESSRVVTSAWSPKIFWIRRVFGNSAFSAACRALAMVKRRREVLTVAVKPVE